VAVTFALTFPSALRVASAVLAETTGQLLLAVGSTSKGASLQAAFDGLALDSGASPAMALDVARSLASVEAATHLVTFEVKGSASSRASKRGSFRASTVAFVGALCGFAGIALGCLAPPRSHRGRCRRGPIGDWTSDVDGGVLGALELVAASPLFGPGSGRSGHGGDDGDHRGLLAEGRPAGR
jgi:hypothetical protein